MELVDFLEIPGNTDYEISHSFPELRDEPLFDQTVPGQHHYSLQMA
jgi:hypothetical protein